MNVLGIATGLLIVAIGAHLRLRPMSPYVRNFAPARDWKEYPHRAEREHVEAAKRWGAVLFVLGLAISLWGIWP